MWKFWPGVCGFEDVCYLRFSEQYQGFQCYSVERQGTTVLAHEQDHDGNSRKVVLHDARVLTSIEYICRKVNGYFGEVTNGQRNSKVSL